VKIIIKTFSCGHTRPKYSKTGGPLFFPSDNYNFEELFVYVSVPRMCRVCTKIQQGADVNLVEADKDEPEFLEVEGVDYGDDDRNQEEQ